MPPRVCQGALQKEHEAEKMIDNVRQVAGGKKRGIRPISAKPKPEAIKPMSMEDEI